MSTQTQSTIVGLVASGLFWLATPVVLGQGGPALQAPPSSAATPAPPASSTFSVLLLKSGKVVRGSITRDASGLNYVLKHAGVPIAYPAILVEKAGGSVEELYQYRLSRLAERDPDERMKLAKWSLTEGLPGRAKEQLAAILEMCPDDPEAKRMNDNIAANDENAAILDPDVRRTNGEMPAAGAPAPLNPEALKRARRDFGKDVLPVIFDLPTAQAVGRARDFTQQIHPILQNRCAGCHNERYAGAFQLVVAKGRKDMNGDVARANLDATLRLINPDDAMRSELLSAGLVPHGNNKNAVFKGPNDLEYRKIEFWVRALRTVPGAGDSVAKAGFAGSTAEAPAGADGFAADRSNRPATTGMPFTPVVPVPESNGFPPLPGAPATPSPSAAKTPPGYLPGDNYNLVKDNSGLPDSAFQTPFAAGGELPPTVKAAQKAASARTKRSGVNGAAVVPANPGVVATTATEVDARTVLVAPSEDPSQLPGMNQPRYPPKNPATADGTKKTKAPEVDRALLEQLIRQRNGTP